MLALSPLPWGLGLDVEERDVPKQFGFCFLRHPIVTSEFKMLRHVALVSGLSLWLLSGRVVVRSKLVHTVAAILPSYH